jgi:hypothetical protein
MKMKMVSTRWLKHGLLLNLLLVAGLADATGWSQFSPPEPNDTCHVYAGFSIAQHPLCAGDTVQMINASNLATDYEWFLNGVLFSTIKNPKICLEIPGVYNVMLVSSAHPCYDTATCQLVVYSNSSSTHFDTICQGDVYWMGTIPLTTTGVFYFHYSNMYGCDSLITIHLEVKESDATFVVSADSAVAQSGNQTWYQWLDCDQGMLPVTGATGPSFQPSQSGNFALATGNGECSDTSGCQFIQVIGIGDVASPQDFRLFPVPAKDQLFVYGLHPDERYTADIIAYTGKQLMQVVLENSLQSINIGHLRSGTYFLRLSDSQGIVRIMRFVVM